MDGGIGVPQQVRGGRPPKFDEPSRPVTVTLPVSTLDQLVRLGDDRAKAIVKAVRSVVLGSQPEATEAEVVPVAPGIGLVVVGPSRHLRSLECLRLVEITPARYILSVRSGTPPETLEVALTDLLDTIPDSDAAERSLVLRLLSILRVVRKSRRMTKEEILLVGMA